MASTHSDPPRERLDGSDDVGIIVGVIVIVLVVAIIACFYFSAERKRSEALKRYANTDYEFAFDDDGIPEKHGQIGFAPASEFEGVALMRASGDSYLEVE